MNAQALRDNTMSSYMSAKKNLELNGKHPVITKIMSMLETDEGDKNAKEMLSMLWDTAQLSSGFTLANPASFSARINRMVAVALEVSQQLEELPPIIEPEKPKVTEETTENADSADLNKFDDVD
jgi:molecular chaperone HtpG